MSAVPATIIRMSVQRMVCTGCGAEANASCNCGKPYVPKAVRAAEAIAANPEKSNRAIASEIGTDEKTVRKVRLTRHEKVLPEWQAALRDAWLRDHPDKTVADYEIAGTCNDTDEGIRAQEQWYCEWFAREGGEIHRRLFGEITADKSAVEKRIGRDGKTRKVPARPPVVTDADAPDDITKKRESKALDRIKTALGQIGTLTGFFPQLKFPPNLTPENAFEAIEEIDEAIFALRDLKAKLADIASGDIDAADDDSDAVEPGVERPAVIKENVLDTVSQHIAVVGAFRKIFKQSSFDPETAKEISAAINKLISKWRPLADKLAEKVP